MSGPSGIQRLITSLARGYVGRAPDWRGKRRLLRPLVDRMVVEVEPGAFIRVDPRINIEYTLLGRELRYDRAEIDLIWDLLRPGMTYVDVGAFVGVMAMVAARRVGPEGRVLALEAGAPSVARLLGNRDLNGAGNVTVCATAVGGRRGLAEYHYYPKTPDQSSVGYFQADEAHRPILVPVITLDECLAEAKFDEVDMMKVDVEGSESAVLEGAGAALGGGDAPLLVMELNPAALRWAGSSAPRLVERAEGLGYELSVIEVSPSGAFANVVGLKPRHRERFPRLADYALTPVREHDWYRGLGAPGAER